VNQLVTCGNITDPRIQIAVDVASALTLVFRSDDKISQLGMRLIVIEIDTNLNSASVKVLNRTSIILYAT